MTLVLVAVSGDRKEAVGTSGSGSSLSSPGSLLGSAGSSQVLLPAPYEAERDSLFLNEDPKFREGS